MKAIPAGAQASTPTHEVVRGETGVLEDALGQPPSNVAPRMHGYGHRRPTLIAPECQVAAGLAVFYKSVRLQETNEFARGYLGKARHAGRPMESSSTCTMLSLWGMAWERARSDSTCCSMASRMLRRASSIVLPLLRQPGRVGLYA